MMLGLNGMPVLAATPETALPATAETAAEEVPSVAEEEVLRQNMILSLDGAEKTAGSFTVSGGEENTDYSYSGGVLTIMSGDLTIAMEEGAAASADRIVVNSSYTGNLTLENVSIDQSSAGGCAFALQSGANVTLNLTGDNTLKSGGNEAGLYVPVGATLTVVGDGDLTAQGSSNSINYGGAGIGGNRGISFGTLVFNGTGCVTGNGGRAAGIGGGASQSSSQEMYGSITINSGTVTGNGGMYGAGIGVAADGGTNHVTILITGGTVTGNGNDYGAGIGSGLNGPGPAITITGGTVVGTSSNGAGIGCGGGSYMNSPSGGSVSIEGGNVTASGKPAIGASTYPATVTISKGTLTTTGGIVAGGSQGGSIVINGGSVSATENTMTVGSGSDDVSIGDFGALVPGEGGLSLGGNITVQDGETVTISKDYPVTITGTVTVENGGRLEVPEGAELINNGAIQVQPGGVLKNDGTVSGSGGLDNQGALEGNGSLTCKITINSFNIGGAAEGDYTYENGVLTIHSGDLSLQNKTGLDTVNDRVVVDGTYNGTLTLEGVNIDRSGESDSAFTLENGASVTLALTGNNVLVSGGSAAGLYVSDGAALTVTGSGHLEARGGTAGTDGGAGIGGSGDSVSFGTVTLKGTGIVTAVGGTRAAGVGSGGKQNYDGTATGTVLIESGTVNATSGQNAAAIGCGPDTSDNRITIRITGGTVNATDGGDGAGIGAGWSTDSVGTIEIAGGVVRANGTNEGAGIGKPGGGNNGSVTISGGTVTANGGNNGEDINCPLFTGADGQAVIYADNIQYTGNQNDWSCLLVSNDSAAWYGTNNHITCDSALMLKAGNLVIPEGSSLTVNGMMGLQNSAALTVKGELNAQTLGCNTALTVEAGGVLQVSRNFSLYNGTLQNDGSIRLQAYMIDFSGTVINRGSILLVEPSVWIEKWYSFTNTETGVMEVDGGRFNVMDSPEGYGFMNDGLLISTNGAKIENVADYECRIFFDGNGGTPTKTDLVTENKMLTDLPAASRSGYVLEGWYTQAEGGEKINSDYIFDVGTTVYAHWTEAPVVTPTPTPVVTPTPTPVVSPTPTPAATATPAPEVTPAPTEEPVPTTTPVPTESPAVTSAPEAGSAPAAQDDPSPAEHTLRFETNGGLPLEELHIGRGANVELWPYNPVRTGYLFAGWYADEALTQPVTTVLMNADKTVYAAWTADPAATAAAGQGGTAGGSQTGSAKPSAEPEATPAPTAEPEATRTPAPTAEPESSAEPEVTATPEASTPAPAEESGLPLWPFLAGGAVIVAGAALLLLRRRG